AVTLPEDRPTVPSALIHAWARAVPGTPLSPVAPLSPLGPCGPCGPCGPVPPVALVSAARAPGLRSWALSDLFLTSLVVTVPSLICLPVIMLPATAPPEAARKRAPHAMATAGTER